MGNHQAIILLFNECLHTLHLSGKSDTIKKCMIVIREFIVCVVTSLHAVLLFDYLQVEGARG